MRSASEVLRKLLPGPDVVRVMLPRSMLLTEFVPSVCSAWLVRPRKSGERAHLQA